ncbi:MAG: hypothetical protein M0D57_13450 [Sphingobacteriales bacterium JAD_PAG50586_3]|nr:MAG: hypothetical protein M0D57_13450 [Sphingobacteriales bacterium JAD_PAG50586_3]
MKTHHLTMFEYDHWANSLLIDVMVEHEIIDDRIWSLMSHIIWAKQVWMKRIMQEDILGYAPFNLIPWMR